MLTMNKNIKLLGGVWLICQLETYLANAQVFHVFSIVCNESLMVVLKKDKNINNNILSNSIRGVLRAIKSLLLFPSNCYAVDQSRTLPCITARVSSFHQGVIYLVWYRRWEVTWLQPQKERLWYKLEDIWHFLIFLRVVTGIFSWCSRFILERALIFCQK